MIKQALQKAFRSVQGKIPGAIVKCSQEKRGDVEYDPVTGANTSTTTTVEFEAAFSEYNTHERKVQGIESGDFRLIVIAIIEKPNVGDVIDISDVPHEVVSVKDYANIAYDLQMRLK